MLVIAENSDEIKRHANQEETFIKKAQSFELGGGSK